MADRIEIIIDGRARDYVLATEEAKTATRSLSREVNNQNDSVSRSFGRLGVSVGAYRAAAVAGLPIVTGLAGAVGALGASAGAAAVGVGALAVGGAGAGAVGLAGLVAVAAPALASIKKITTAQSAYALAVSEYGKASTEAATARKALNAQEAAAGKGATKVAAGLQQVIDRWQQLSRPAQTNFFSLAEDGFGRLNNLMPLFARSATTSIAAVRSGFDAFLKQATGPDFTHFVNVMTTTFARSVGPLGDAFGSIAKMLERIAVAAAPDIVRIAKAFDDMVHNWAASTGNAKQLQNTVHGLVMQTQAWFHLFTAASNLIVAALIPGLQQGKEGVRQMTGTLHEWTDWVKAHPAEIRDFFKTGMQTLRQVAQIIAGFMPQILVWSDAMKPISAAFLAVTQALNSIKIGNVSALSALLGIFLGGKLIAGIKGAATALGLLAEGESAAALGATGTAMGGILGPALGVAAAAAAGAAFESHFHVIKSLMGDVRHATVHDVGGMRKDVAIELAAMRKDTYAQQLQLVKDAKKTGGEWAQADILAFKKLHDVSLAQITDLATHTKNGFKEIASDADKEGKNAYANWTGWMKKTQIGGANSIDQLHDNTLTDLANTAKGTDIRGRDLWKNWTGWLDKTHDDSSKSTGDTKTKTLQDLSDTATGGTKQGHKLYTGVGGSVFSLAAAVAAGMQNIGDNTKSALSAMDVGKAFKFVIKSIKSAAGINGHQQGGVVGAMKGALVPGTGSGDTVPLHIGGQLAAMVEPNELVSVANRNATEALMTVNSLVPRLAKGGAVKPNFDGHPSNVVPAVAKAIGLMEGQFPGLQVTATTDGTHVAGSYHYQGKAVDMASGDYGYMDKAAQWVKTSGLYKSLLEGIHNPNLAVSDGKIYPGAGPFGAVWAAHANHIHLALDQLGKVAGGVAGATIKKIKRQLLQGPDGALKDIGQSALDKVRTAANAYLQKHAPKPDTGGAGVPGGFIPGGGGSFVKQAGSVFLKGGMNKIGAAALLGNAYQESTWNASSVEGGWGFHSSPVSIADVRAYAAAHHQPWNSAALQANFLLAHLSPDHTGFSQAFANDLNAGPLDKSVTDFVSQWEHPHMALANIPRRIQGAQMALKMGYKRGGVIPRLAKGGRVAMIGDSLGYGMKNFGGGFPSNWDVDVKGGRNSAQGLPLLHSMRGGSNAVVWELGTNDTPASAKSALGKVGSMIGNRGLALMTTYGEKNADAINNVIRGDKRKNALADWHSIVSQNPSWVAGDSMGIHPNATGYKAMRDKVVKAGKKALGAAGKGNTGGGKGGKTPLHQTPAAHLHPRERISHKKLQRRTRHFIKPLLARLRKLGLDPKLQKRINFLSDKYERLDSYASNAAALDTDTADGIFQGDTEEGWLKKELPVLLGLRNHLVRAHNLIFGLREKLNKGLSQSRKSADGLSSRVGKLRPRIHDLQERAGQKTASQIQKLMETEQAKHKPDPKVLAKLHERYHAAQVAEKLGNEELVDSARLAGLKGKVIPGFSNRLQNLKGKDKDLLSSIAEVEGPFSKGLLLPMEHLPPLGVLGGEIFTAQQRLWELSQDDGSGSAADDGELVGLLQQQLLEARQAYTLSQQEFNVFSGFFGQLGAGGSLGLPFLGAFEKGGAIGADGLAYLHSGEYVLPEPVVNEVQRSAGSIGNDSPTELRLVVAEHPGQMTRVIDARIDGKKAEITREVDQTLGRKARQLTYAPGR